MKKFLSVLLSVVLCFSVCSVGAFAAGEDIVVKAVPSKTSLKRGDTFTVNFNITTNKGFCTLGLEVGYDDAVLEVACPSHADGKSCTGRRSPVTNMLDKSPDGYTNIGACSQYHTKNPYKIMWAFGNAEEDVVSTGRIATLTFKVKDDAKIGATTITLNVDQASSIKNGAYAESKRAGVSADIIIICSHTYDNACDTTCDVCGATRTITHTYTNACDTECNVCKKTRTISHTYSNTSDTTCNICGYIRVVIDSTTLTYVVSNGKATITDAKESIAGNLIIPSTLGGYTVISIGAHAFENCKSLTSVIIPNSVINIGFSAFSGCENLTSITIGSGATSIGDYAFEGCTKLTSISVVSANSYYSSDNGVLFNKNKTTLICYPAGKTDTSYVIPNSVTSISDNAFSSCSSLKSITLPNSVTDIGDFAFSYCSSLKTVYYRGSSQDKSNININFANDEILNATWYYNSCINSTEHTYGDDLICDECGHKNFVLGDIDGTGEVDLSDVTNIARYFAGWNVDCNASALDVDGDGLVNLNDLIHLAQYVAGWDVELH